MVLELLLYQLAGSSADRHQEIRLAARGKLFVVEERCGSASDVRVHDLRWSTGVSTGS